MRSELRIPFEAKHAFPDVTTTLQVVLDGVHVDVLWRPNGSRSGTIGVGAAYMRRLRESDEPLQINVNNRIYTILRK